MPCFPTSRYSRFSPIPAHNHVSRPTSQVPCPTFPLLAHTNRPNHFDAPEVGKGQVSEWLKEPVSKTGIPATVSRVRIPPCPWFSPPRVSGRLPGQGRSAWVSFRHALAHPDSATDEHAGRLHAHRTVRGFSAEEPGRIGCHVRGGRAGRLRILAAQEGSSSPPLGGFRWYRSSGRSATTRLTGFRSPFMVGYNTRYLFRYPPRDQ